ncbi:ABC transporter substrate-binding protein [Alkalimarinus coralli]|uniref:ABC transporter substrate-binding protein n=1 Tax=Alkalimarinus coralli TaxID=2935863 RepID=UPI00202B4171|nr:ABC transporter substrate-binding protein [Alkalimarinus coralli]
MTKSLLLFITFSVFSGISLAEASRTVVDLTGREVTIPVNVARVILGESRYIPALAIVEEDPISKIVGMLADLKLTAPGTYRQFKKKFPEIENIPLIGHTSADSFSVEQVLTLRADVAIFGLEGHGPTARHAHVVTQLEQAGVAVVFLDFRKKPLENTPKSIALLGKIFGQEQRAEAFNQFYREQLQRVTDGLSQRNSSLTPTSVFIHSRVGLLDMCCETMVRGMMADFSDYVGANNVAKNIVPGAAGVINLEHLLTFQPQAYIATAVGSKDTWTAGNTSHADNIPPYIVLGADISEDVARASFHNALSASNTRGVKQLEAVKQGRAYAIWHHFYNTPLNVVAAQVFAKWLYPKTFQELDPHATLNELYERFQPFPAQGTYWVMLNKGSLRSETTSTTQPDKAMSQP